MVVSLCCLLEWLTPTCGLAVVVTLLTGWFLLSWLLDKTPSNLPPGPRGWTTTYQLLKGNFTDTVNEYAVQWNKEFGPLVYISCLGEKLLFVGGHEDLRALLGSEEHKLTTTDRASSKLTDFMYAKKDMFFSPYDVRHRKQRRMLLSAMHVFGSGVERYEDLVHEELSLMVDELKATAGQDVQMDVVIGRILQNIVYILVTGQRPTTEAECEILFKHDEKTNALMAGPLANALNMFPFLWWFPNKFRKYLDDFSDSKKILYQFIDDHKSTYEPGKTRGMLDFVFEAQGSPGSEWLDDETVHVFIAITVLAGNTTTRSVLQTVFIYLLNNPEVTKKVQDEIDRVIGDRAPRVEDRVDMHYTEAVVLEALRIYVMMPLESFRVCKEDIHYKGYTIPKNTVVIFDTESIHHDPKIYEDPWTFRPERLLDDKGVLYPTTHEVRKSILPFGVGPRMCPGEAFSRSRAFLFVVHILQNFDILPPESEPLIEADGHKYRKDEDGAVRHPPAYKVKLRVRSQTKA